MIFGNHLIVKKSTVMLLAALVIGGGLLYKHYNKPGNDLEADLKDVAQKGKRKVEQAVDEK